MNALERRRVDAHLSRDMLARKAGVHRNTIVRIEDEGRRPHAPTLGRLAAALNVRPSTLLEELRGEVPCP